MFVALVTVMYNIHEHVHVYISDDMHGSAPLVYIHVCTAICISSLPCPK